MKKNMGGWDRVVRFMVAAVIAVLFFTETITGTTAFLLMALAIIFALTSFIGFCPIYTLFGLNTCSVKNKGS